MLTVNMITTITELSLLHVGHDALQRTESFVRQISDFIFFHLFYNANDSLNVVRFLIYKTKYLSCLPSPPSQLIWGGMWNINI